MQGLAVLRAAIILGCLPLLAACGGGGGYAASAATVVPATRGGFAVQSLQRRAIRGRSAMTCPVLSGPLLPPGCTVYVGAFVSPTANESPSELIASTATFENQIGRKLAMHMHYYQWTDAWPGVGEQDDLSNNRIPVISWHCGDTDAHVAAGLDDAMLAKKAAKIAAYGGPIFVRYKWEMNLLYNNICKDPSNDVPAPNKQVGPHYSPSEFVAAWQHIRAVFAANGANNVVWLWNISSNGAQPGPYYPGANYVDWIGVDRYDTNGATFEATFDDSQKQPEVGPGYPNGYPPCPKEASYGCLYTYPTLMSSMYAGKPIMIGETGIAQTDQPAFLSGVDQALQNDFPDIKAFIYWDSTGERGQYQLLQYGIQAFAQFASGPYEQGYYQPAMVRRFR